MRPVFRHVVYATAVQADDRTACESGNLWQEIIAPEFPLLAALPLTLAELELLLQGPVVDLTAIAEVAKRDAAVTAQLLLLANRDRDESDRIYRLEDCLVHIGISRLRGLVCAAPPLRSSDWQRRVLLNHSRRTALAAEAMACCLPAVDVEKAYLAGLLHLLPELVSSETEADRPLPRFLREVIHGFKHPFTVPGEGQELSELVRTACEWASEMELLPAGKSPHRLIRG